MLRFVIGAFLLAHGAVHMLYLAPVPEDDASWPFLLDESWIVPESARRGVGIAMAAAILAVHLLAAMSIWGLPGLSGLWAPLLIAGATLSLLLFAAYWHPWLSIGVLIALTLAAIALTRPGWWERAIT